MLIPKSNWTSSTLEKEYFHAKLVDNFKEKYLQWSRDEGEDVDDEMLSFIDSIICLDTVQLYQFPNPKGDINGYDYFEKVDDNYVIPRELFDLV